MSTAWCRVQPWTLRFRRLSWTFGNCRKSRDESAVVILAGRWSCLCPDSQHHQSSLCNLLWTRTKFCNVVYFSWSLQGKQMNEITKNTSTHSDYCDVVTAERDVSDGGFIADRPIEWRHLRSSGDAARQDDVTVARCRCDVAARDHRPIWQFTLTSLLSINAANTSALRPSTTCWSLYIVLVPAWLFLGQELISYRYSSCCS